MRITSEALLQVGFWLAWLIVPIVYELIPALFGLVRLFVHRDKHQQSPAVLPRISLIVPVYNSATTLYKCLESIQRSTYPANLISVIVADNQSTDESFTEFNRAQQDFSTLYMQWISTTHGKAQALNSAIYNANGRYIIHIDSDGILEKNAILNMVTAFENDPSIDALTGTILTQRKLIKQTPKWSLRLLRENEYYEYAQSFLAGRTVESTNNQLFTMAGAFSAFRREKLLQTHLYNVETIGEDIDMTFQIRYELKGKVLLCPNAIFYVEPIADLAKLYVQRQRWQRGELQTVHQFLHNNLGIMDALSNFVVRRLIVDHTILFLRMIWLVAFVILIPFGYSLHLVLSSFLFLYLLYLVIGIANFICVARYLRAFPGDRSYYVKKWWIILCLPVYFFIVSLIQMIGIVNAMTQPAQWRVKDYHEEGALVK